jgi:hypothetical protein
VVGAVAEVESLISDAQLLHTAVVKRLNDISLSFTDPALSFMCPVGTDRLAGFPGSLSFPPMPTNRTLKKAER